MRLLWLGFVNFFVSFMVCGVTAGLVITPYLRAGFGPAVRAEGDPATLMWLALGFLGAAIAGVVLYRGLDPARGRLANGLLTGAMMAALGFAEYLKLVGWSSLPVMETLASGGVSALGPFLGGLAMGLADRTRPHA